MNPDCQQFLSKRQDQGSHQACSPPPRFSYSSGVQKSDIVSRSCPADKWSKSLMLPYSWWPGGYQDYCLENKPLGRLENLFFAARTLSKRSWREFVWWLFFRDFWVFGGCSQLGREFQLLLWEVCAGGQSRSLSRRRIKKPLTDIKYKMVKIEKLKIIDYFRFFRAQSTLIFCPANSFPFVFEIAYLASDFSTYSIKAYPLIFPECRSKFTYMSLIYPNS